MSTRTKKLAISLLVAICLGIGAGFLVWGLASAHYGEPMRTLRFFAGYSIAQVSEAIGLGAAFLAAGLSPWILRLGLGGLFKIYGIAGIACGTAGTAWGIVSLVRREQIHLSLANFDVQSTSALMGLGIGVLASAIVALCLSGRLTRPAVAEPDDDPYET